MADSKDVELRIRARDYSQKTLAQVVDSLQELAAAQKEQLEAAKKGEVSAKALEDSYRKIEQAARALASQGALIKTYEAQADALQKVEQRVTAAREAQETYAKSIAGSTEPTKAQIAETAKLAKEVERAERAQRNAADRLANTTAKLSEYGVAVSDIAAAQSKITTSFAAANTALERQDEAINSLDANLRRLRATEKEAAQSDADSKRIQAAREAEQAAADRFAAERKANMESSRRAEYERTWVALLTEREAAEKEVAATIEERRQATMKAMADDLKALEVMKAKAAADAKQAKALKALGDELASNAKGYTSAASAKQVVAPKSDLAGNLKDIGDPAAAAMRNIDGVEKALAQLQLRVALINGPVKQARESLQQLSDVQRATVGIAQSIDAYNRQVTVVRAASVEYLKAAAAAKQLATELQSGKGGDDIEQKVSKAQGALKRATEEMLKQRAAAAELRAELKAAGVDTSNLAAAEAALVGQAERTAATMKQLTAATEKYGTAKNQVADKAKKFAEGERTTLSFAQRIRGEFLGMAAASVGLYGALGLVQGVLEQVRVEAKVNTGLAEIFDGDRNRAAEEAKYLREQADAIGFVYNTAAMSYSRFAVAAKSSGATLQEIRYIFENVSKAAIKAGLSNDDYQGTLKAVEQMMSKGVVQSEELRGQLGDRLPGAVAKFASSMNMTVAELGKAMEGGLDASGSIVNFARELDETGGKVLDSAAVALVKAEAQFINAKNDFQKAMADSGFADAYTRFLASLANLLNSEGGKNLAQLLGDGLEGFVMVLQLVADNIDTVGSVVKVLVSYKIAAWFVGAAEATWLLVTGLKAAAAPLLAVATGATAAGGAVGGLTGALALLRTGISLLTKSTPILLAFWAVWEAGSLALDMFTDSAKKARKEKAALAAAPDGKNTGGASGSWGDTPEQKPGGGTAAPKGITKDDQALKAEAAAAEKNWKKLREERESAEMKGAKDSLAQRQKIATQELVDKRKKTAEEIKDEGQRAAALALIDDQIAYKRKTIEIEYNAEHAKGIASRAKKEENEAQRRLRLIEDLAREMQKVEDEVRANEAKADPNSSFEERLRTRLKTIETAYNELQKKIDKVATFDPKRAGEARTQLNAVIAQRKEIETIKVQTEELNRLEKNLADTQALRTAKLETQKALFESGAISLEQYRTAVEDINGVFGIGIEKALDSVQEFAESMKKALDPSAYQLLIQRIATARAQNNPAKTNATEAMSTSEAAYNRLLDERKRKLEEIDQQQKLGLITQDEAVRQTNVINGQYRQQIIDAGMVLEGYITSVRALTTDPAALASLDALSAKIRMTRVETEATKQSFTGLEQTMIGAATAGLNTAFSSMVDTLGQIVTGQENVGNGFKQMAQIGLKMFQDLIKEAIMYLLKLQLINALKSSGNPFAMAIGTAMSAGMKHGGGMAGSPSGGSRSVSPAVFAGAMKLHGGGLASGALPGLKNNEVPRILLKNEEVVTRDDPRHVLNGGKSAGATQRFVLVDDRAKVAEAMASAEGDEVQLRFLRRNQATLKSLVNS
jgi:tape measure domain-containing protein